MLSVAMRDRLDPLIAERAPWLFSGRPRDAAARRLLMRLLGYDRTLAVATAMRDLPAETILATMGEMIARDAQVEGLGNLPRDGAAMIVCNHPTGIADGIVLWHLISAIRPDLYFYANRDILRVLPQMDGRIAPVEWRKHLRTHEKTRATMDFTRAAIAAGRMGVIFPSGRLAQRIGLSLHERPWMPSAAMIARKFALPVVPVHIRARNSALFYLFDLIHPTLRDITLFHEVLNKARQPFRLTIGRPIPPESLPVRSEEGIEILKSATLALGGRHAPQVSLLQASRLPRLRRRAASA
jgi:putative hemolysin